MGKYSISIFEKRKLKKICKRITIQSHRHESNIVEYLMIMYKAMQNEFTEDNKPTLDGFIQDCLNKALTVQKGTDYEC